MNKLNIHIVGLAVGMAFSAGAIAQGLSKSDSEAGKDTIATQYRSAHAGCASQGQGTTTGSAAAGGIYRELVTPEIGMPATVQPLDAAPAR